jgi:myo-inositol-1(or 4)-monophosphatase
LSGQADRHELLRLATDIAREAGELVVRLRTEGVDVADTKSSEIDIVTEADRASERLIKRRILASRPDDGFVGEEGTELGTGTAGTTGVVWIVDPIDGTVNYLYGLPHYAVSIAAEVDGRVVAGVVHAPVLGLEYAASLGDGATCNGRTITVRAVVPLAERLVATGFNYEQPVKAAQAGYVARLLPRVRDIRRIGSCALDLCGVASGTLDAYVEEGAHIWDHAAAGLIVEEAGGVVEVTRGPSGKRLLISAPSGGYDEFREAVADSGFIGVWAE